MIYAYFNLSVFTLSLVCAFLIAIHPVVAVLPKKFYMKMSSCYSFLPADIVPVLHRSDYAVRVNTYSTHTPRPTSSFSTTWTTAILQLVFTSFLVDKPTNPYRADSARHLKLPGFKDRSKHRHFATFECLLYNDWSSWFPLVLKLKVWHSGRVLSPFVLFVDVRSH
jgi:hypothetical protein